MNYSPADYEVAKQIDPAAWAPCEFDYPAGSVQEEMARNCRLFSLNQARKMQR